MSSKEIKTDADAITAIGGFGMALHHFASKNHKRAIASAKKALEALERIVGDKDEPKKESPK